MPILMPCLKRACYWVNSVREYSMHNMASWASSKYLFRYLIGVFLPHSLIKRGLLRVYREGPKIVAGGPLGSSFQVFESPATNPLTRIKSFNAALIISPQIKWAYQARGGSFWVILSNSESAKFSSWEAFKVSLLPETSWTMSIWFRRATNCCPPGLIISTKPRHEDINFSVSRA